MRAVVVKGSRNLVHLRFLNVRLNLRTCASSIFTFIETVVAVVKYTFSIQAIASK